MCACMLLNMSMLCLHTRVHIHHSHNSTVRYLMWPHSSYPQRTSTLFLSHTHVHFPKHSRVSNTGTGGCIVCKWMYSTYMRMWVCWRLNVPWWVFACTCISFILCDRQQLVPFPCTELLIIYVFLFLPTQNWAPQGCEALKECLPVPKGDRKLCSWPH